jgi:excisionase family DNA binding protein
MPMGRKKQRLAVVPPVVSPKSNRIDAAKTSGPSPQRKPAAIIVLESPRLYLTIKEAAQYLRVSRRTIYTLMERKQLTYTRVREGLRFRLQWLNDYLDKRTVLAA